MPNTSASFYNSFSFLYPIVDVFLKPQKIKLAHELLQLPEGNLLDVGVGNGSHLPLYTKHIITGIDTSSQMLDVARKKASQQTVLLEMNAEQLSFADHTFDYIVLSHVLAVVDYPEQVIKECYRVLKPNGRMFILNHFTPDNALQYVDKAVSRFSKYLHFKSVFYIEDVVGMHKFTPIQSISLDKLHYFKLLIYSKA